MFEWLKKLFSEQAPVADTQENLLSHRNTGKKCEKPCKTCSKPIVCDLSGRFAAWSIRPNPERSARGRRWADKRASRVDGDALYHQLSGMIRIPAGQNPGKMGKTAYACHGPDHFYCRLALSV